MGEFDLKATFKFIQKTRESSKKITLIGYSQGSTVSTYALADDIEFYKKHVSLYIAIAPSIQFKYSEENYFKAWAKEKEIQQLALTMDYLEYNGEPHRTQEVSLVDLIWENYNWVCLVSEICKMPSKTANGLDASPSVDINRQDFKRL